MSSQNRPQTAAKTPEPPKKSYDKLFAKLQARGMSLVEFRSADEKRRKKMLQDDYQDIKNEAGWLYDEPIEFPAEVVAKEVQLNKEKLEAASKVK